MSAVEEGFLVYEPDPIPVTDEDLSHNAEFFSRKGIFNPLPAEKLDPKDPRLLDKMFEPYLFENEGQLYMLSVSRTDTSRRELDSLEVAFQNKLKEKQARKGGICPIRQQLHAQLFDEIIRQGTVNLPQRGLLLMRVRDDLKMTFAAYQTLYEGSLVFGSQKSHLAQQGLPELDSKLEKLRKRRIQLKNKKVLLQNELSAVKQGYRETKMIEQKVRSEQIAFLSSQTKRLEEYLNGIYGD